MPKVVRVLLASSLLLAACSSAHAQPAASGTATGSAAGGTTAAVTGPPASATPSEDPAQAQAQLRARRRAVRARVRAAVTAEIAQQPRGAVSVAALDTATGTRYLQGERSGMWTASAYKLLVLVALLLERQGPHGTGLSSYEQEQAAEAIEHSDNKAGYALFLDAGGSEALEAAARRLGMRHTQPGASDPTFTRSGAADWLGLLQALVSDDGPLTAASRRYALHLMQEVEADQRWGVGVVADPGTRVANKNGWLSIDDGNGPDEDDHGRWAVTSVGVVRVHHHRVLLAVFTQHQPDFSTGVRLVQRLARLVTSAVTTD